MFKLVTLVVCFFLFGVMISEAEEKSDIGKYSDGGQSYSDEVWEYYKVHTLRINYSEISGSGDGVGKCQGRVDSNDLFVFTCANGKIVKVTKEQFIQKPFGNLR